MKDNSKYHKEPIYLCHKAGMCPVLYLEGDSFILEDSDQTQPGTVCLNVEQARGLIAALKENLPTE